MEKQNKLPEKPQFKPFDKIVFRSKIIGIWRADFYSFESDESHFLVGRGGMYKDKIEILHYNEETAKLIGTSDEWKGGEK